MFTIINNILLTFKNRKRKNIRLLDNSYLAIRDAAHLLLWFQIIIITCFFQKIFVTIQSAISKTIRFKVKICLVWIIKNSCHKGDNARRVHQNTKKQEDKS